MEIQGYYTVKETLRGHHYYDSVELTLIIREHSVDSIDRLYGYLSRYEHLLVAEGSYGRRQNVVLLEGRVFVLKDPTRGRLSSVPEVEGQSLNMEDYTDSRLKSFTFFETFCREPHMRCCTPTTNSAVSVKKTTKIESNLCFFNPPLTLDRFESFIAPKSGQFCDIAPFIFEKITAERLPLLTAAYPRVVIFTMQFFNDFHAHESETLQTKIDTNIRDQQSVVNFLDDFSMKRKVYELFARRQQLPTFILI